MSRVGELPFWEPSLPPSVSQETSQKNVRVTATLSRPTWPHGPTSSPLVQQRWATWTSTPLKTTQTPFCLLSDWERSSTTKLRSHYMEMLLLDKVNTTFPLFIINLLLCHNSHKTHSLKEFYTGANNKTVTIYVCQTLLQSGLMISIWRYLFLILDSNVDLYINIYL